MSELGSLIIAILAIVSLVVSVIVYLRIRAFGKRLTPVNKQVNEFIESFRRLQEESYKTTESFIDFIVAMLTYLASGFESQEEADADRAVGDALDGMSEDTMARLRTRLLKDVPALAEAVFGTDSPTTKQLVEVVEEVKKQAHEEEEEEADASED